jgi:hypothetical protein
VANLWGVPVGFGAGTGITSVEQARTEARWAEQAGFDTFRVSQIFGVDPVVALAAVGSDVPGLHGVGAYVDAGVTELRPGIGTSDPRVVGAPRETLAGLLAG